LGAFPGFPVQVLIRLCFAAPHCGLFPAIPSAVNPKLIVLATASQICLCLQSFGAQDFRPLALGLSTARIVLVDKGRSTAIAADADARLKEISGRWPSHGRLIVRCSEDFGALPLGLCFARIVLVDKGRSPEIYFRFLKSRSYSSIRAFLLINPRIEIRGYLYGNFIFIPGLKSWATVTGIFLHPG
jgi:hypothetical protein